MPERDDKLEALLQKIQDGTKAVFESENYKRMLTTMAKFHSYSINNLLLIAFQKPEATAVAGFRAWQTKFNRRVKKGEKGIQIIGYAPRTVTVEIQKKDERGVPVIGADGRPVTEKQKKQIPAYKVMYVFDVSQTEGEPLPAIGVTELQGDVRRYAIVRKALLELSPVPVVFEAFPGGAKGKMDHLANQITVQPNMSEVQTIKTLVHEIAHAQMHNRDDGLSRKTKEVEAESVAFVVCQHLGIDTSDYSFPYVASWSGNKELSVLQASLNRIRDQARENIEKLDAALEKVLEQDRREPETGQPVETADRPEPEPEQKLLSFAERMAHAKQKAIDTNGQRMAGKGPIVQEVEIGRRNLRG